MKVLIITYYWPPAGGSGVQRWLKFVKYLLDFDIEPVVYCPDSPNYEVVDDSLIDEIPEGVTILKHSIFEPNSFLKKKKVATARVSSNPSLIQKMMQYIRGNYFIPDARKYWIKPSVKFLSEYLKNNKVDAIISTGPPHSLHLIGMQLKQKTGIKWIADFRDPMANLFYNDALLLTEKSKQKIARLEREILQNADKVITVSNHIHQEFQKVRSDIEVITNGFDDELANDQNTQLDKKFSVSHIGLLPTQSNSTILWKVLQELINENAGFANDFQLNLVGNVSDKVVESITEYGLQDSVQFTDYVPHSKAIELQKKSQVLLLLIPNVDGAKGIVTGKIFEYLTSKRPTLAIAPTDGDVASIIKSTNTGVAINFDDAIQLKSTILDFYKKYQEDTLKVYGIGIQQYHRKNLTEKLAQIIKEL
ncbi:MAG: glycosyltransferase family 4 protein [Urechidicola sp.]|nr:glycosyltransferase family 4 protein [Urechidicola sp.]